MLSRSMRYLSVMLICIAPCKYAEAQFNSTPEYVEKSGWSLGMNAGESDLWGDVGTKSFIDHYSNSKYTDKMMFMGGMFGRYTFSPCFSVRLMFNYGTLYATDKWNYDKAKAAATQGEDPFQRYARNQDAKTNIFENTVMMEFVPMRMTLQSSGALRRGQVYLAAGVSFFRFENYSTVANSGTWVKTYDLHLEGQGFRGDQYPANYNRWALGIPLGLGYRWDIGRHLNLGVEYIYRMTFTDYLDGVSGKYINASAYQYNLPADKAAIAPLVADKAYYSGYSAPNTAGNLRGNASNKDAYSSFCISFYYKINASTNEWAGRRRTHFYNNR